MNGPFIAIIKSLHTGGDSSKVSKEKPIPSHFGEPHTSHHFAGNMGNTKPVTFSGFIL